jgi:hypothetical protein
MTTIMNRDLQSTQGIRNCGLDGIDTYIPVKDVDEMPNLDWFK